MDFDSLALLDCGPLLTELLHHFLPHEQGLVGKFVDSLLGLLLEEVQSETPLNDRCFAHEELEVGVCNTSLVSAPILLDDRCSDDGSLVTLEHHTGDFDSRGDFIFVDNAIVKLLLRWLLNGNLGCSKVSNFLSFNVGQFDLSVEEKLLDQVKDIGDRTPLVQVGPTE